MKKIFVSLSVILLFILGSIETFGCSSAVISGKITPDGRPLLWKHRDSDFRQNCVKYFNGELYPFIAVVNSVEENLTDVWTGTNSAGFSIMNTQSYNLEEVENEDDRGAANGRVMRRALEICATVEDFRHFLDTLSKPSYVEANFGVIDAKGGAAMFEVDYHHYVMYDANNSEDAPYGYIARTNFSFAGKINKGAGYVRYMIVDQALMPAAASMVITPEWIFRELSRTFVNPMLGIDLKSGDFNRPKTSGWFVDQDFISRSGSTCSVVIQGVKAGENPELTTMWTVLGYPPTGVAIPLWVKNGDKMLPEMVLRGEKSEVAPLCDWSVSLADKVFCYDQGMGTDRYFYWELLYNNDKTGFMQKLAPVEEEIFQRAGIVLNRWYEEGRIDSKGMELLYNDLEQYITDKYKSLFALSTE